MTPAQAFATPRRSTGKTQCDVHKDVDDTMHRGGELERSRRALRHGIPPSATVSTARCRTIESTARNSPSHVLSSQPPRYLHCRGKAFIRLRLLQPLDEVWLGVTNRREGGTSTLPAVKHPSPRMPGPAQTGMFHVNVARRRAEGPRTNAGLPNLSDRSIWAIIHVRITLLVLCMYTVRST